MKEKAIERHCQNKVIERKGISIKFSSPSNRGVPDRVIIMPGGKVGFLELKATGKKPTSLQRYWLNRMQDLGAVAGFADSTEAVDNFIELLC